MDDGMTGKFPSKLGPLTNVQRRKSHRDLDLVHRSNFVPGDAFGKFWRGRMVYRFPGFLLLNC